MYENENFTGDYYYNTPSNNSSSNNSSSDNGKNNGGKAKGFGSKLVAALLCGALFGGAAGGCCYGVLKGTGVLDAANIIAQGPDLEAANSLTEVVENAAILPGPEIVDSQAAQLGYVKENKVTDVAKNVMPAMVQIIKNYTYTTTDGFGFFWPGQTYSEETQASGSGIIIGETDTEYLIVTNNHVVEDPNSLEVTFVDGSTTEAFIKGTDAVMDLAVIAVKKDAMTMDTKSAIIVAKLGDSEALELGEQVVAIGNALGYGQSVTTGIISALNREIKEENGNIGSFIQTDAAINPGNSGGALLNMDGEVIGINSSKSGGSYVEGIGYAIPISNVTDIIADLMERTTKIKVAAEDVGYIGITLQEVTPAISERFNMPVGIYISEVSEGGAAANAGLTTGDIITKFDKQSISSYAELQNVLQYYAAGTTVEIVYERHEGDSYTEYSTILTLGRKPVSQQ